MTQAQLNFQLDDQWSFLDPPPSDSINSEVDSLSQNDLRNLLFYPLEIEETTDEEEWIDQVYLGPRLIFNHQLTRGVKPNSVMISGWGVESFFGQVRVPESTCKVLFKCNASLDFLHKIVPDGKHLSLVFLFPYHRQPVSYLFEYTSNSGALCLDLGKFIK
jgi:hypothetical protein